MNDSFTRIWTKGPHFKYVWATCKDFFRSGANPKLLYLYFQEKFEDVKNVFDSISNNMPSRDDEYKKFPFPLPFSYVEVVNTDL